MDSYHSVFELNFQSYPEYTPGGLHLQLWEGETPLSANSSPKEEVLLNLGETIRWTHAMDLHGGVLTFEIISGTSTTWGSVGGQGYLKSNIVTKEVDLNDYNPEISVRHSGVSFGGNRVQSMVLKKVRYITVNGDVYEDDTARVAYPK